MPPMLSRPRDDENLALETCHHKRLLSTSVIAIDFIALGSVQNYRACPSSPISLLHDGIQPYISP